MAPPDDIGRMATALKKQGIKCEPDPTGSSLDLWSCKCSSEALADLQPLEFAFSSGQKALMPAKALISQRDDGDC